jgi:hypothetical protein
VAKRNQQPAKRKFSGASEKYRRLALDEARRVPWPKLMQFVDESLQWEIFVLWIRAVVNAANEIPPVVEQELERKIPGFVARLRSDQKLPPAKEPLGELMWNAVGTWIGANVMLQPKTEGWLNAVNFFSSRTMTYMKVWSHWERVNREWRVTPPPEWPSYQRWESDAAAVTQMPNPDGEPQYILDAMDSVPATEWDRMLSRYRALVVFGVWMELILDLEGLQSAVVAQALAADYPEFSFTGKDLAPTDAVQELLSWGITNVVRATSGDVIGALTWHIKEHPEYYAIRGFAIDCHHRWSSETPAQAPEFRQWRELADQYSCRC